MGRSESDQLPVDSLFSLLAYLQGWGQGWDRRADTYEQQRGCLDRWDLDRSVDTGFVFCGFAMAT